MNINFQSRFSAQWNSAFISLLNITVTCPAVDIPSATQQGQHRYGADAEWGVLD